MKKFREALFNEIKGSLFEYLVARGLASRYGVEGAFMRGLPSLYQTLLEQQDRMTREVYPELVPFLPAWAEAAAEVWYRAHPELKVQGLTLLGQYGPKQGPWSEADMLLHTDKGDRPLSLKLNKRMGFVNTKSGGARSFLSEYFPHPGAALQQERLNARVDEGFVALKEDLYALMGVPSEEGWSQWVKRGLSELPGELPPEARPKLLAYYAALAAHLGETMREIAQDNREVFRAGLRRLLGFGLPDMGQMICLHDWGGERPERASVLLHEAQDVEERLNHWEWLPARDVSYQALSVGDWELQIRVKPMNRFTVPAVKINCSVRYAALS